MSIAQRHPALQAPDCNGANGAAPFAFLLAFTFVLIISPQSYLSALQPFRLAFVTAGFAVTAFLLQRLAKREPILQFRPEILIACCLAAWAVMTVPFSYWPGGSVSVLIEVYFKTLVIFWLIAHVIDTQSRLQGAAWALSLMAVPLSITAINNFRSGAFIGDDRILGYDAPLTGNPNDLALMLNLILPLAIALILSANKTSVRVLLVGIVALITVAIMATFSRSGFITLAIIIVMYIWRLFRQGRYGIVMLIILAAMTLMLFSPAQYTDRISTITSIEADHTGSAQSRWSDSKAAIKYTVNNPMIGSGIGNNTLALNEMRGDAWIQVHNVYLVYSVELGLPGLLLFVLLLFFCMKRAKEARLRAASESGHDALYHLSDAVFVSLVAYAVAAMFHTSAYHLYFYLIGALAIAAQTIATRNA
jgi:O-antigen ligase